MNSFDVFLKGFVFTFNIISPVINAFLTASILFLIYFLFVNKRK